MIVIERMIHPAPAAFHYPGGWARAVEEEALADRLERLVGHAFRDFTDDSEVAFNRAADTVVCSYYVPSVLPIRGSGL